MTPLMARDPFLAAPFRLLEGLFGMSGEEGLTVRAGAVELARPGVVGVPLGGEQPLLLEPAQERVEGVGVDLESRGGEVLEERVPVPRGPQVRERREDDGPPSQLLEVAGEHTIVDAHAGHYSV